MYRKKPEDPIDIRSAYISGCVVGTPLTLRSIPEFRKRNIEKSQKIRWTLHIYAEQCQRWQQSTSSPRQQTALAHLADVVSRAMAINTQILTLLPELKDHTIERLMEKSDLELGLEELQRRRMRE